MPVIRPIIDLGYRVNLLNDVASNQPMFLTKNGYGQYVILKLEDYHALLPDEKPSQSTEASPHQPHFKTTDQWLDEERLKQTIQYRRAGKNN